MFYTPDITKPKYSIKAKTQAQGAKNVNSYDLDIVTANQAYFDFVNFIPVNSMSKMYQEIMEINECKRCVSTFSIAHPMITVLISVW